MKLIFEKQAGNNYTIKDAVIQATVELLGGGKGMVIVLHSVKAVEPLKEGVDTSPEAMISYLGHEIMKQKRFGTFIIIRGEKVVFSLDEDIPTGSRISSKITQID
jgi:hypothetical protein